MYLDALPPSLSHLITTYLCFIAPIAIHAYVWHAELCKVCLRQTQTLVLFSPLATFSGYLISNIYILLEFHFVWCHIIPVLGWADCESRLRVLAYLKTLSMYMALLNSSGGIADVFLCRWWVSEAAAWRSPRTGIGVGCGMWPRDSPRAVPVPGLWSYLLPLDPLPLFHYKSWPINQALQSKSNGIVREELSKQTHRDSFYSICRRGNL